METKELGTRLLNEIRRHPTIEDNPSIVAEFVGVTVTSVRRWLSRNAPPNGEELNKLFHLLELWGVPMEYMDTLRQSRPFGYILGKLLAFDIITMDEAREICDVKNSTDVYRSIKGLSQTMGTQYTSAELLELYGDRVETTVDSWKQKLPALQSPTQDPKPEPAPKPHPQLVIDPYEGFDEPEDSEADEAADSDFDDDPDDHEFEPDDQQIPIGSPAPFDLEQIVQQLGSIAPKETVEYPSGNEELITDLASELMQLIPRIRRVAIRCTDEERALLRELMGDSLFDLSTLINRMTGSRAFRNGGN